MMGPRRERAHRAMSQRVMPRPWSWLSHEWTIPVLAVLLVLGAAVAIEGLNTRYAASLQAQLTLVRIEAQANRLSALQWQIAAQHTPPDDFDTVNEQAEAALHQALDDLTRLGVGADATGPLRAATGTYDRDIHRLFDLYLTLQNGQAQTLAVERVDPEYRALLAAVHSTKSALQDQGQHLDEAVQVGFVLTLALCGIGLSVLFWRYRRVREANEALVVQTVEQRARASEEDRFRSLVQNASDVIAVVAVDGTIRYLAPSIARVFGHDPAALVGTRLAALLHPNDAPAGLDFLTVAAAHTNLSAPGVWRVRHHDGSWRHVETSAANLLDDPHVQGIVLTLRDISDRTALEQQLIHQAFHDPLTRLANRALFRERVEHALRRARRHHVAPAVLFLDLDNFKTVNDSQGHAAGDAMLVTVAERLRSCLRPDDTAARLGGDEFAVLLEDTANQGDPIAVAERLVAAMRDPMRIEGRQVQTSASVGIAIGDSSEESVDDLLRNADVAMYMAKNAGKGRYAIFDPAVHAAMMRRLELEADLKRAIQQQEFVVYYQPIVDLKTGALVSVEALVRWAHPERGLVPPGEFIPLAEETGAIVPIGRWVLHEACRQAQEWRRQYPVSPPRRVAVNLSGLHLQQPAVVEDVVAALDESGLDPNCLTVEITESSMMQDTTATIAKLQALKALGVSLAIDDFGTGYSSLSYLQQFPIDLLKIDRAFVSGVGHGAVDSALARAVVSLGSALGVQTVAEGIEQAEQVQELRELGCERGQGYYFSRPQESAAITALLEREQQGGVWAAQPDAA